MFLKLILGSMALLVVVVISTIILKRARPKHSDLMFDLRTFEPNQLDRLMAKGLLSEEEAKRVRAVVTERAIEWSEQQRRERIAPPVDLNTLLAEAENYRRNFEHKNSGTEGESGEEPKE